MIQQHYLATNNILFFILENNDVYVYSKIKQNYFFKYDFLLDFSVHTVM